MPGRYNLNSALDLAVRLFWHQFASQLSQHDVERQAVTSDDGTVVKRIALANDNQRELSIVKLFYPYLSQLPKRMNAKFCVSGDLPLQFLKRCHSEVTSESEGVAIISRGTAPTTSIRMPRQEQGTVSGTGLPSEQACPNAFGQRRRRNGT